MNFDIKLPFNPQDKMTPKEEIKFYNGIQDKFKRLIPYEDIMYKNNPINYTSFEDLINSLKIGKLENNDKSLILKMSINKGIFDDINENLSKDKNDKEKGLFDNNIKTKQSFYTNNLDLDLDFVKGSISDYIKKYYKNIRG